MITEIATVGPEGREAVFSEDRLYRYRLEIVWDSTKPTLITIGLNPSTADHLKDDNTIRRGKQFARSYGCGSYRMLNAFAFRSTNYRALFRAKDPNGPENTLEFLAYWCDGGIAIACWGSHMTEKNWKHFYRGHEIKDAIPGLLCFRTTPRGHPEHPLYLPADLQPQPFTYA